VNRERRSAANESNHRSDFRIGDEPPLGELHSRGTPTLQLSSVLSAPGSDTAFQSIARRAPRHFTLLSLKTSKLRRWPRDQRLTAVSRGAGTTPQFSADEYFK
jgi:hypothetical protein